MTLFSSYDKLDSIAVVMHAMQEMKFRVDSFLEISEEEMDWRFLL
jgi:hypothetical protein